MNSTQSRTRRCARVLLAVACVVAIAPGDSRASLVFVPQASPQADSNQESSRIPPDHLDSLVAPIALYPDPLLAQVLAASTYPLELMQLQQWLMKHPGLKEKALVDAVSRQPWDPSIQAMAALPDVVKRLADDIQWTTDLGNAVLAQQSDVMEAVQRMRRKAQEKGNLASTSQQTVETKVIQTKEVIVIEQADPRVVYVPSYNPVVVYGAPIYPYPPIYYPPPGYYAAGAAISFGVGVAMGAAWGGGWGWGAGWRGGDLEINNFNNFNRNANFNRNTNISGGNRVNALNNRGTWQHNPQHRGGAPYRDRTTASRYGGNARGDSLASRQASARQQVGSQGGNLRSSVGTTGTRERAGTSSLGSGNLGNRAGSGNVADRAGSGNFANRSGGADRVGSRDLSRSGNSTLGAFGSGSGGFDGSRARSNSSRGSSTMRSRESGSLGGGSRSRGGGGGRSRGGGRR